MDNVISQLQERYDPIAKEEDFKYFCLGLKQYFDFVEETPLLKKVIKKIEALEEMDYSNLRLLEKQALAELEVSEKKLRKIIKDNSIDSVEIKQILGNIDAHRNGLVVHIGTIDMVDNGLPVASSSKEFCYVLENRLFEIAKELNNIGKSKLIEKFLDKKNLRRNIYGNWVFSDTYFLAIEEKERLFRARNRKIYDYLETVKYVFLFAPDSQHNPLRYDMKKYKFALRSLHLYIKDDLNKQRKNQPEEVRKKTVKFFPAYTPVLGEKEKLEEWLEKGRLQFQEEKRKDEEHRDLMVIEERKGKDLTTHWLQRIIEKCLIDDKENVEINLDAMGVRPYHHPEKVMVRKLLGKLKGSDCIKDWGDHSDCFVLTCPDVKKIKEYKLNLEKALGVEEDISSTTARENDLIIFSNDKLKITFNGVAFSINGEYVSKVNKGGIPMKIWDWGYKNNVLCVPWKEIEKLGLTQEETRESINKTHRRSLFNMLEKYCKTKKIALPNSFFENLLRPVPGEGLALFITKVRQ